MNITNSLIQTIIEGRMLMTKQPPEYLKSFKNRTHESDFTPIRHGENVEFYPRNVVLTSVRKALDRGEPVFIFGEPGVSKSQSIIEIAKERAAKMGRKFIEWAKLPIDMRKQLCIGENAEKERTKYYILIDVRTNLMAKEDATGIPDIMNTLPFTNYRPQSWLYYVTQPNSAGMIFLDEINQGNDEVLKSLMQLFLDKQIGDHKVNEIGGNWDIASAGNVGSSHNNTDLPPALTNRAFIIGMSMTTQEWVKYAKAVGIDDAIITFVESGQIKNADGTEDNPYLISNNDIPNQPFASPRSIEKFDKAFKQIINDDSLDTNEKIQQIAAQATGTLGTTWAKDFIVFLDMAGSFDAESFSKDLDEYTSDPVKYLTKHGFSKSQIEQVSNAAEAAAENIEAKYFKHNDRKNLAIVLQLAEELYEEVSNQIIAVKSSDTLNDTQRLAIKQYVQFLQLMRDSNNEEINAIIANKFISTVEGRNSVVTILSHLKRDIALKVYANMFQQSFGSGAKIVTGKFAEESEEVFNEQSTEMFTPEQFKKLMQIKRNVDLLAGLENA